MRVNSNDDDDGLARDAYTIPCVRAHFSVTSDARHLVNHPMAVCVSSWAEDTVRSHGENIQTSRLTDTDGGRDLMRGEGDWGLGKESEAGKIHSEKRRRDFRPRAPGKKQP